MTILDDLERATYGDRIELELRRCSGQSYEDLFNKIMKAAHGDNFQSVKASGKIGDWKADGYLTTEKRIYQSYAPSSGIKPNLLLEKITDSFTGAQSLWGDNMLAWSLVHNSWQGLPAPVNNAIENHKKESPSYLISIVGPDSLKDIALGLPKSKLIDLFGVAASLSDMKNLTYGPIKSLLNAIASKSISVPADILPVSVVKLEFNKLSSNIEALLVAGRSKETLVEDLISGWPDPEFGEQLAMLFRERYKNLVTNNLAPNDIFDELRLFAGGESASAEGQVATLAVLSYFFERCDIFENAPEGWIP